MPKATILATLFTVEAHDTQAGQIAVVREFNRFYTQRLGLLRRRHLDGEFSLTEARILYEIGSQPQVTAASLRNYLGLDAGYISRLLALLTKRKLVRQTASRIDAREKFLTLTAAGKRALERLNRQSSSQVGQLLANHSCAKRDELVRCLQTVRSILSESGRIVRLPEVNDDALRLLQEYYEAVRVVQRDTPQSVEKILADPSSGLWLAYLDEVAVGCVMLKPLGSIPLAAECKRLYVQPSARGHRIAGQLLDAQEDFARSRGLHWIYLDSNDELEAAIALYRKRGFTECERYNDNPQATIFLRKNIMPQKNFTINTTDKPISDADRAAVLANPGFGRAFTEHMVTMKWTPEAGWHEGRLNPYHPFQIDPATAVLHYAQAIFEGLKAYPCATENQILLFRPEENANRLARSAQRMAIPPFPPELFVEAIEELVRIDHRWVPSAESGGSLYLRPFIFASEAALTVRPAREYIFCLIASPVGDYFSGGQKPLKVWVSSDYVRAARGGTGSAKCAGNYASGLVAQAQAAQNACDQTIFLDAIEQKWIEELGGMNICFVTNDRKLLTPPLSGTILPGVTRKSVLTLAAEEGLQVEEAPYSYEQLQRDAESGCVTEAFACGTAAVIVSIGTVCDANGSFNIGEAATGPVTAKLRERLVNIQRGVEPDQHGWVRRIAL